MQKKAFSKRDMHSLKRNISFHRFAAVGSADVSGRYSVLSSPSCLGLGYGALTSGLITLPTSNSLTNVNSPPSTSYIRLRR